MNNLSPVSVYENVTENDVNFSNSAVYRTINDLLCVNGDVDDIVHCPLCMSTFEYKFSFFEHLITFHHNFVVRVCDKTLRFKECPFCIAKFYGKHLTAKHGLMHHSKAVKEIFVDLNSKCIFCGIELNGENYSASIRHIEEEHFIDFEEEFRQKFSTSVTEMTFSEFMNSTVGHGKTGLSFLSDSPGSNDIFSNGNQFICSSTAKDFDEASKLNCFNFSELKNQLQKIKRSAESENLRSKRKSILKNIANNSVSKSVRRVLRFDLPGEENFRSFVLEEKLNGDLASLGDCDRFYIKDFSNTSPEEWNDVPKYSSTPDYRMAKCKSSKLINKKRNAQQKRNSITNLDHDTGAIAYEFQCGRCRKLFKENFDLVCHMKKSHARLALKCLKPSYRCALCDARFYINYYLLKHHRLHKPY